MGETAVGFGESISHALGNYATFSGRAARSEFWWFSLLCVLVSLAGKMIDAAMHSGGAIEGLMSLLLLLPSLAVAARRLHDTDRSAWWLLMVFVPIVGWILLLVWYCMRGTNYANRFGSQPT
jgi:uncharacterized membrane protein YhaH (DUF805 family)